MKEKSITAHLKHLYLYLQREIISLNIQKQFVQQTIKQTIAHT